MEKRIDLEAIYEEYKDLIFPIIFYLAGLFIGAFLYSKTNIDKVLSSVFDSEITSYLSILSIKLSVYIFVFSITILLGLCLIGFPFINIIPLVIGIEIALKLSYYYANYGAKGIGYSLLLIIPESSAYFTVLLYTIRNGNDLSKYIFDSTIKKSDIAKDNSLKQYLKSFLIYFIIIVVISAVNSLAIYLLNFIIKI